MLSKIAISLFPSRSRIVVLKTPEGLPMAEVVTVLEKMTSDKYVFLILT